MNAAPGDRLVIRGHNVGDHDRVGILTEVRGPDGSPPYVVKWLDTEHECLIFPGADAVVQPGHHHQGAG